MKNMHGIRTVCYNRRGFRVKTLISSLLLMLLLLTTACQPTPEKQAVIGRQEDILNMMTSVASAEFEEIKAPEHVSAAYDFEKVSITFDADVVVPKTTAYPVVKVSKRVFSDEEYLSLIKRFAGTNDELYSEWNLSKRDWMEKIIKFKPHLDSGIVSQERIDYMQEQYEGADEKASNPLVELSDLPTEGLSALFVKTGNSRAAQFTIIRNDNYFSYSKDTFLHVAQACIYQDSDFDEAFDTIESFKWLQPGEPEISQEEAYKQALAIVNELSVGLELYSAEPCSVITDDVEKSVGWEFIFTKKISELQAQWNYVGSYLNPEALPSYGAPWLMEMFKVVIDKNGLCVLAWHGASEIIGVAAESAALESFDFIQSRIANQLRYIHANPDGKGSGFEDVGFDIKVIRIELGTSLVSVKDEPGIGLYIPTWYVDYRLKWSDEDEQSSGLFKEPNTVIFSAIDGSYIEPRATNEEILRAAR